MKLMLHALAKYLMGLLLIGVMLFLPAWTLDYPGAWLFIAVLFVPMLFMGIVLFAKAPALLEKRLSNKEKEKTQKGVIALSGLMFPIGFVLSAIDFRFGWSSVPLWLVIVASVLFLVGYGTYAEVMRENAYLSRTVEVQEDQTVISTGLYGLVRHPMYLATLLMFLPLPLILGSLWGLIPFALYPIVIVIRLLNEEKVLTEHLDGYAEYKTKVKYRLIPFIWYWR
jgi:protein-S-isoprenylcysteine O-methyltransferase Ste14